MKKVLFLILGLIVLGITIALILKYPPYPIPYFDDTQNEQIRQEEVLN